MTAPTSSRSRVAHELRDVDVLPPHPIAFGHVCEASAVLGLLETVDDRAFEITHGDLLRLVDPVLRHPEQVLRLASNEAKLRAEDGPPPEWAWAGGVDDQLGLRHHAVNVHRGRVREIVVATTSELPGYHVRVTEVLALASELERHQDEQPRLEPCGDAAVDQLPDEAPGRFETRACDSADVLEGED